MPIYKGVTQNPFFILKIMLHTTKQRGSQPNYYQEKRDLTFCLKGKISFKK